MKKHKDTDYLFLSAFLHAREARQGEGSPDKAAIFRELEGLAPDKDIVSFFRLKYDYHNVKVFLKSLSMNQDHRRLYSPLGRVSIQTLEQAHRNQRYDALPGPLAAALRDAEDTLTRTGDPRLADFILDLAYIGEMKTVAERTGSPLLTDYAALFADSLNLRALVRMLKSGVKPEQAGRVLNDCGRVSRKAVLKAYPEPAAVLELYRTTKLAPALAEAEQAVGGEGFAPFEAHCRSILEGSMADARYVGFGEEVLIRYLCSVEAESGKDGQ